MRIRPFAHGIASLVFALFASAPLTAMAVSVCPSGAVCIDEPSESGVLNVTSDSPLFQGSTVLQLSDETWQIQITMSGAFRGFGDPFAFELLEPGSGTISDMLVSRFAEGSLSSTTFTYSFSSDDESGNIVNVDVAGFCPTLSCGTAVEDGTFQLAITGAATSAGSFDVYLKSDVEAAVPEPSTGLLLALGLITLATRLRCRKRNVRPACHSAITEVRRPSPSSQAAPR
jgi:hypothetical protein